MEGAFITSASRGVLPIRQIDERWVGGKIPDKTTAEVMKAYQAIVRSEIEEI